MMEMNFFGVDFYHILFSFFMYGLIGWIMECIFEGIRTRKFDNRGFIKGPFCTIYGIAYAIVFFLLRRFDGKYVALFFVGMLLATSIEYVTAVALDWLFHKRWWDYSDFPLNFQGRICFFISIGWGIVTVLFFRVLQPAVSSVIDVVPRGIGVITLRVLLTLYFIDLFFSATSVALSNEVLREKWEEKKERFKLLF